MKKFFVLLAAIMLMMPFGFSQNRVTFTENFNSTNSSFTRSPQNAWLIDTTLSVSGKAAWGFVPNAEGDSIELISPVYDLSNYAYAYLRFTHICKVSDEDLVTVEYRENFVGSTWKPIPYTDYRGESSVFRKQRCFHHGCYSEWLKNDLTAQPDNSWWKVESFDVSQDVAYAEVQFKFKLKKGSTVGTNFAWGWFIDNFELMVSTAQINPPVVQFISPITAGTVYSPGPYTIYAKAAKRTPAPLKTPVLRLTYTSLSGAVTRDSILMTSHEGDSIWKATIPAQNVGTKIAYTLFATDTVGNNNSVASGYTIGRRWGLDSNSVALLSIDDPFVGALAGQPNPVVVTIENRGLATLTSAIIKWSVNGVAQTPYKWSGSLNEGYRAQVRLGTYVPTSGKVDTLVAVIGSPNGVSNTAEDTLVSKAVYACASIPTGTFTINKMGLGLPGQQVYKSIGDVLDLIRTCGTSGNIVISIAKGSYDEDIELVDFMNAMDPNSTLTIQSATGKAEDVEIAGSNPGSLKVLISNSANITIRNLTLRGTGTGVSISDSNYNIEISGCRILLDTETTTTYAGIAISDGQPDKIRILNNYVKGAYYGFYTRAISATQKMTNITFSGNEISSPYYGTLMYYTDFDYICNNTITTRSAKAAAFYGLDMTDCNAEEVSGNRIHTLSPVPGGQGIYAVRFNQDSSRRALVMNNEIIYEVTGTAYGIYTGTSEMEYVHNTVIMYGSASAYGLYCNNATVGMDMHFYNNNFISYTPGYPMYFSSNTLIGKEMLLDYNNSYGNSYIGYLGGAKVTLNDWILASQDQNAANVNPTFANYAKSGKCLHYTGLSCPMFAGVTKDIQDSARKAQTAMGCYTSSQVPFDAALIRFVNLPVSVTAGQATTVKVRLMNAGAKDTIRSIRVNWTVNNTAQTPFDWKGNLLPYADTTLTIGKFNPVSGVNELLVWTSMPNGMRSDDNADDDTLRASIYGCQSALKGTYAIGGSKPDFKSLDDALFVLSTCGVGGPVRFELAPGQYNPMVFSGIYQGMSKTNTVTITSQDNNNMAEINCGTFGVQITGGASYFRFEHLKLNGHSANYGFYINGAANDIQIKYNDIQMNPATTSTQYAIYCTSGQIRNYIHVVGNRIDGGYYGIYFYNGTSNTPANHGRYHRIDSNVITNVYYYNVYGYYTDFESVSHNRLTDRTANKNSNFYGIYTSYCNHNMMQGNRIHAMNNEKYSSAYGLYLYYSNYPGYEQSVKDTAYVYNNELYIQASNTYPIYNYYSRSQVFHNSVYARPTANSGYGMYLYTGNNTAYIQVKGNNVCMMHGTTCYPIYCGGTISYFQFDYNNYYSTESQYLAYMGGGRKTLTDVQTYDPHAVKVYPDFLNVDNDMRIFKDANIACPAFLANDILDSVRPAKSYMGCYEGAVMNYNACLASFVNPAALSGNTGSSDSVVVLLTNKGDQTLTSLVLNWSVNGVLQTPVKWSGKLATKSSEKVALGVFKIAANANRIVVWCEQPNGKQDQLTDDDTISYSMYGCALTALSGKYVLGNVKGATFATIPEALSALSYCGIAGPVTIEIAKGNYPSFTINTVFPGASATNTVTFTSQSGKAEDVVIGDANSIAIKLKDAENLYFRNLTFGNQNNATIGVELEGVPVNVHFEHCNIFVDTTSTSGTYGVYYNNGYNSGGYWDGLYFIGNHVDGGMDNFYLFAYSSGNTGAGITVDSNLMTNAYAYGYNCEYWGLNASFSYNEIRSRANCRSTYYGARFYYYPQVKKMSGNRVVITNTGSSNTYGIMLGATVNGGSTSINVPCTNNEVLILGNSTGTNIGIHASTTGCGGGCGAKVDYYHNSVVVKGNGPCYALYYHEYFLSNTRVNNAKYNNLFVEGGAGSAPLYYNDVAVASTLNVTDYNNYFNSIGSTLADFAGAAATSLKAIMKNTGADAGSVSERPYFTKLPANAHTDGYKMVVETDKSITTVDLESKARGFYTNMGCYHDYVPSTLDAQMVAITAPINAAVVGKSTQVEAQISNLGSTTLNSVEIHWMANGVVQQAVKYITPLASGAKSSSIQLGSFIPKSGVNVLTAWVDNPNGSTDGNKANDTVSENILGCDSALHGTYRVGSSAKANFVDLEAVAEALDFCGIDGPTVFEIESGSYGAVKFSSVIPGVSDKNTITFISVSKDPESVVIGAGNALALTMMNSRHMHFKYLTIGSTNTVNNIAVKMSGFIENVKFYHCRLYVSNSTTNSNSRVVEYNNSSSSVNFLKDVEFIGNEVRGGYYGFYLYYAGGTAANCRTSALNRASVRMDSNYIYDQYYYPVYTYYYCYIPSFSHNTIRSRSGASYNYGAYFYYYNLVDSVVGNHIFVNVSSYAYSGIRLYYRINYTSTFGTDILPAIVANNEIVSIGSTQAYGIYTYYANAEVINNSVYCKGATNYAFYLGNSDSTCNLDVRNNIFMTESGATNNYLVYCSDAATLTTYPTVLDYNDFFTTSTKKNAFYCGSARTFANWQSTYNMDGHSVEVNPGFSNLPNDLSIANFSDKLKCNRHRQVMRDINNDARTSLTIMGAYSTGLFEGYDLQAEVFVEPQVGGIQCVPNSTPVKLGIYNMGTYDADFAANPLTLYLKCESDSVNFVKKIAINKGTIGVMKRDTFELEANMDITYPGLYKLTAWLEWAKDQDRSDDTLKLDYYVDKTVLPYDNNFTGTFAGVATNQAYGNITWEVVNTNPVLNPVFGTGSLLFRSSEARGSISQALFTSVSLQGTYNPHLYFWYAHDNANPYLRDQMEVRISQDGGATFKTLQTIYRYDAKCTQPTWKEYKIDLSNYRSGSCIIIAFTAYSYGGGDQTVDRVKIIAQQDMRVTVEAPSVTDFAACNMTGRSLKVYLENLTSQEVPFKAGDSITVEMSGASNFVYKQALTGRLENRELDSLILSPIDYVGGGQFDVKVYVNAIDSNAANDTAKFSLNLNPDLSVMGYDAIGFTEPGDTVHVGFTMKNTGNLEIVSPFNVKVVVNGVDTITELVTASLKPGDTLYYQFKQGIIVPMTTADQPYYLLDVYAQLPCDADGDNDSVRIIGNVNIVDNGILSIITPAAGQCAMGGEMAKVEVRLFNNGNVDNADSIVVTAVIDSAGAVYATLTEKVAPMYGGENRNYTFKQQYRVPRLSVNGAQATYNVTVYLTAVDGDVDLSSDTAKVEACVQGGVGIDDATADRWMVGQNVPNPAVELTRIPYVIPEAGVLTLRIMGMNGQVLYREEIAAEAGNGDIRVNLSDLAAGVYYYSVEYRGERVVRKMNVTR